MRRAASTDISQRAAVAPLARHAMASGVGGDDRAARPAICRPRDRERHLGSPRVPSGRHARAFRQMIDDPCPRFEIVGEAIERSNRGIVVASRRQRSAAARTIEQVGLVGQIVRAHPLFSTRILCLGAGHGNAIGGLVIRSYVPDANELDAERAPAQWSTCEPTDRASRSSI